MSGRGSALGFAVLLGTVITLAGNPPEKSPGEYKPQPEKEKPDAAAPSDSAGVDPFDVAKPHPKPAAAKNPQPERKMAHGAVLLDDRTAVEKIEAALKQPTSIEFVETPLKDVIDYLKDCHHIEIEARFHGLERGRHRRRHADN